MTSVPGWRERRIQGLVIKIIIRVANGHEGAVNAVVTLNRQTENPKPTDQYELLKSH